MKPNIEEKEDRLLAMERSYWFQLIGAGFIAAIIVFASLGNFVFENQSVGVVRPDIRMMMSPSELWAFAFWFFIACRAQTKLTLIKHIKHHRNNRVAGTDP